jgi:cell wall-associated NlpC family hydrolase
VARGGMSGVGLALATAGGIVLYAGYKGVPPREVLRSLARGASPATLQSVTPSLADTPSPVGKAGAAGAGAQAGGGGQAAALVQAARSQIGKPYRWATAGPDTFDCSGLVIYCLKQAGVQKVPRFTTVTFGSWASKAGAMRVKRDEVMFGDIVIRTGHMGIAVSNSRMIHAPHAGSQVQESPIPGPQGSWWGWRMWPGSSAGYWRGI